MFTIFRRKNFLKRRIVCSSRLRKKRSTRLTVEQLEDRRLLAVNITEFAVPTAESHPYGITAGPDGRIWFTEESGNNIGRMTTAGEVTAELVVPTANCQPAGITTGPDGNLWFAEYGSIPKQIVRLTPSGGFTEFPLPSPVGAPAFLTAGPDGNLWFSQIGTRNTILDASLRQARSPNFQSPPLKLNPWGSLLVLTGTSGLPNTAAPTLDGSHRAVTSPSFQFRPPWGAN